MAARSIAIMLIALTSAAWSQTTTGQRSIDKEIGLGRRLAADIEIATPRIADPVVDTYLEKLARKLSAAAHTRLPITVRVLRDDQARASVLPGGFIFLSSGLIRRASSEAELAGAIAHQIGHVAAGVGMASPASGDRPIPLVLLGGAWGACTRFGDDALLAAGFKSRASELERKADRLGSEYAYEAGYDPDAFRQFLERVTPAAVLPAESGEQFAPRQKYVLTTSAFEEVRARMPPELEVKRGKPSLFKPRDEERPTVK